MATNPMMSTNAGKAALDALLDLLDGGSGAGHVEIWTGSMPATPETADSGTKLATLALSDPAFGSSVDNGDGTVKATANSISDDTNAAATGTAGYFRAKDSNGVVIVQGTVGTSNADMILNTTSIVSGSTVSITSWTCQLPTR